MDRVELLVGTRCAALLACAYELLLHSRPSAHGLNTACISASPRQMSAADVPYIDIRVSIIDDRLTVAMTLECWDCHNYPQDRASFMCTVFDRCCIGNLGSRVQYGRWWTLMFQDMHPNWSIVENAWRVLLQSTASADAARSEQIISS